MQRPLTRHAVLISGNGSNLQALIDAADRGQLPALPALVISNRADAYGLERARHRGIASVCLDHRDAPSREAYDRRLTSHLANAGIDLVILAGFMRILSAEFVEQHTGRLLNIHPSLLPDFKGLNTHQRALDAGAQVHGCSVHYVTAELDGGPVIGRGRLAVSADDTAERLATRVHALEHRLYPRCVAAVAAGEVWLDEEGHPQGEPLSSGTLDVSE